MADTKVTGLTNLDPVADDTEFYAVADSDGTPASRAVLATVLKDYVGSGTSQYGLFSETRTSPDTYGGVPGLFPIDRDNSNTFGNTDGRIYYMPVLVPSAITLLAAICRTGSNAAPSGALMRVGAYACGSNGQPTGSPLFDSEIAADGNGIKTISPLSVTMSPGRHVMALRFTDPTSFVTPRFSAPALIDETQAVATEFRTETPSISAYAALPTDPAPFVESSSGPINSGTPWPFQYRWEVA